MCNDKRISSRFGKTGYLKFVIPLLFVLSPWVEPSTGSRRSRAGHPRPRPLRFRAPRAPSPHPTPPLSILEPDPVRNPPSLGQLELLLRRTSAPTHRSTPSGPPPAD